MTMLGKIGKNAMSGTPGDSLLAESAEVADVAESAEVVGSAEFLDYQIQWQADAKDMPASQ